MSTVHPPVATTPATAHPLRRIYFARSAFAVVWAGVFAVAGSELGALAGILLVLYPVVDAASALIDTQTTRDRRTHTVTIVNVVISVAAAIGLGVAATGDMADVLRVWGAWAIVSGLVQLVGAVRRRSIGGQGFLIASGAISVLAGGSFTASAADADSMTSLAGYAVLGGIFFLVSAFRLGRSARTQEA